MIGSDFVEEKVTRKVRCSECGRVCEPGTTALVSHKYGKVMKRVCGEECRLEFDARFWNAVARRRSRR